MQSLVYIFIALAGLAIAVATYFGLTFSPIEAFVTGLGFVAIAVAVLERTLRRRAEGRFEHAIEALSRRLAADAEAGAALGQRLDALAEDKAGQRLGVLEADISVLGTVVRQVAEAVAEHEEARQRQVRAAGAVPPVQTPAPDVVPKRSVAAAAEPAIEAPVAAEPAISLDAVRQGLDDGRLRFHLQPVVTLPQRKTVAYDLTPRLALESGEIVDVPDFPQGRDGEAVRRRIDLHAIEEAVAMARQGRVAGEAARLYVPVRRATLVDAAAIERILALLDADRAAAGSISLLIAEADWGALPLSEKAALAAFVGKGVALALADCRSLRLDFARLAGEGVASVRVDAPRFLGAPESFTDFHAADVTPYLRRFGIEFVAGGIASEEQLLMALEDGVEFAQGPHLGAAAPARAEAADERLVVRRRRFGASA